MDIEKKISEAWRSLISNEYEADKRFRKALLEWPDFQSKLRHAVKTLLDVDEYAELLTETDQAGIRKFIADQITDEDKVVAFLNDEWASWLIKRRFDLEFFHYAEGTKVASQIGNYLHHRKKITDPFVVHGRSMSFLLSAEPKWRERILYVRSKLNEKREPKRAQIEDLQQGGTRKSGHRQMQEWEALDWLSEDVEEEAD